MTRHSPIHLVQRNDGIWQVEREDDVVPLSIHGLRDDAIDAALAVARHDHCGLALDRDPRPEARWEDLAAWALLRRDTRAAAHRRRAG